MRIDILPSAITSINLLAGMAALVYAINGNYRLGAILILVAAVLDGLDGKVARRTGTSSDFGKQLDSLSDLVSFGVAPAILVLAWQLDKLGIPGILAAMVFTLCGALRLARFNVMNISDHFLGIPITMAGSLVALLVLVGGGLSVLVLALLVVLIALLMVSRIKIPKL